MDWTDGGAPLSPAGWQAAVTLPTQAVPTARSVHKEAVPPSDQEAATPEAAVREQPAEQQDGTAAAKLHAPVQEGSPARAESDGSPSLMISHSVCKRLHPAPHTTADALTTDADSVASAEDELQSVAVDTAPAHISTAGGVAPLRDGADARAPEGLGAATAEGGSVLDRLLQRMSEAGELPRGETKRTETSSAGEEASPAPAEASNKYLQRLKWPPLKSAVQERSWQQQPRPLSSLDISARSSTAAGGLPPTMTATSAMRDSISSFSALSGLRGPRRLGGLAFGEGSDHEDAEMASKAQHWTASAVQTDVNEGVGLTHSPAVL